MESMEAELQEMLKIGRYLGSGRRYLLYYYGRLAITNEAGLMRWPEGPKVIVAVIKPRQCVCGLSPTKKACLLAKLYSLDDAGTICKGVEMSKKDVVMLVREFPQ
ncbi:MAG: hypothetical protein ACYSUX_14765 [Planctomycetota bacterium]|jgi:hypothetical protein